MNLSSPHRSWSLGVALLVAASLASEVRGQIAAWIDPSGGLYEDPGNWAPNVAPGATSDVQINVGGTYTIALQSDQSANKFTFPSGADLSLVSGGPGEDQYTYTLATDMGITNSSLTFGDLDEGRLLNMEVGGKLDIQGGELNLLNGAQLNSQTNISNSNIIEGAGGVDGRIVVSGTDAVGQPSRWQSGGGTNVGDSGGAAGLAILGGGQVSSTGSVSIGAAVMADGSSLEVRGTSIDGAPSSFTSGFFQLGFLSGSGGLSRATAQVIDGANTFTGSVQVFRDSMVIVDGEDLNRNPSRWEAGGFQVFGGFVDVLGGGHITSDSLSLDRLAIARVEGVGADGRPSQWDVSGNIRLGSSNGFGSLLIDGGHVTSDTAEIGAGTGSSLLSIEGTPSAVGVWENTGDAYVGGSSTGPEADGLLRLFDSSAQVSVGGTLTVWSSGTVTMHSGGLFADTIDHTHGGAFNFNAGTLSVNTFNGDLLNGAGTLAPGVGVGVGGAGASTIIGVYTQQSNGKLALDIGGTGPGSTHDLVNITGAAQVDGLLELTLIEGFIPDASDELTVFAGGSLIGFFDNVNTGQRLATTDGRGSFRVHYGIGSAFNESRIVLSDFELLALLGDANNDGVVNTLDIDPFVLALTDPSEYAAQFPGVDPLLVADINSDGAVNTLDIDPFVTLLTGPLATPTPEPSTCLLLLLAALCPLRRRPKLR